MTWWGFERVSAKICSKSTETIPPPPQKSQMTGWKIHHERNTVCPFEHLVIFQLVMLVFRGVNKVLLCVMSYLRESFKTSPTMELQMNFCPSVFCASKHSFPSTVMSLDIDFPWSQFTPRVVKQKAPFQDLFFCHQFLPTKLPFLRNDGSPFVTSKIFKTSSLVPTKNHPRRVWSCCWTCGDFLQWSLGNRSFDRSVLLEVGKEVTEDYRDTRWAPTSYR